MNALPSLPPFEAIVVAAGKGLRVGGDKPKQFRQWRGKPLVRHSVETLIALGANEVVVAIAQGTQAIAEEALAGLTGVTFVVGGKTRQQSVSNALKSLTNGLQSRVLIHDAARPDLPPAVIERLLSALEAEAVGAIPVLPIVDSVVFAKDDMMGSSPDRDTLRRVQTPQAFWFDDIMLAHRNWKGPPTAGDDAQVLAASGGSVALVQGDERLKKITFAEDFEDTMTGPQFRVGQGYDVHRLAEGEELWLCGIKLDHHKGLAGHSDADVALHAITDAVLGAIGAGDIGTHFPPSDPEWAGARSAQFLEHAVKLAANAGYTIGNVDLTLICEAPKIGPHRPAMRSQVAIITGLSEDAVSIKATTTERLGFTGREEGIAAQAIVGLVTAA
ncbi:bifunctional 2-C-methyl-D-erythritol 4-phosphate cytidylyltransferase/2-C-methyl-D-erythritol 2,4-cyclodiphosphate synthase [Erythrobacter insulae]|uniref:Bifunctional enzyme IspD/IspF n=1 Tax=Erythrobacter insulae TaxID=2584124 RepID=A0A547PEM9_9SPHN|nr:bifunctional 2-C-methyl-D-erythritol 4-phosphate cytidylyltransferase/2-C-methyl-D-erythritol 2,4-cyclodiphosphate synthase [Erythrobacter insulae]TRD12602.1 bifunctional 2-C-methyl-D-erythritol 4-phosphate cytidylyltransferase/2-C-methyl-D-erythritol 2,4-cyclodiphosphate synthase [Erythrobacter insulae]